MERALQANEIPRLNFLYSATMLTLTISWFVAIIRASILSAQDPKFSIIATVIISSILFSLSLPLSIVFYLSSTGKYYKQVRAILPDTVVVSLNRWIERIFREGSSFENGIIVVGAIMTAALVGQSAFGLNPLIYPISIVLAISFYSIDQRMKKKKRLLAMLIHQEQIPVKFAKKQLDLGKKALQTMVLDLAVEGYPIAVDEEGKVIYRTTNIMQDTPNIPSPHVTTPSISEICAYCGEHNPIVGAKFCIKCGASMVPAK